MFINYVNSYVLNKFNTAFKNRKKVRLRVNSSLEGLDDLIFSCNELLDVMEITNSRLNYTVDLADKEILGLKYVSAQCSSLFKSNITLYHKQVNRYHRLYKKFPNQGIDKEIDIMLKNYYSILKDTTFDEVI